MKHNECELSATECDLTLEERIQRVRERFMYAYPTAAEVNDFESLVFLAIGGEQPADT